MMFVCVKYGRVDKIGMEDRIGVKGGGECGGVGFV